MRALFSLTVSACYFVIRTYRNPREIVSSALVDIVSHRRLYHFAHRQGKLALFFDRPAKWKQLTN